MVKRIINFVAILTAALLLGVVPARAATTTANLNILVSVLPTATLTIGSTTLTFKAKDPTMNPVIVAEENPIPIIAKIRNKDPLTLFVMAADDLRDGSSVIPASAITWTAANDPFVEGTMSKTSGQPAARFPGGSGSYSSYFNFYLANSPSYIPGTYSMTINYTLSTP